jgi:hypothetical protein
MERVILIYSPHYQDELKDVILSMGDILKIESIDQSVMCLKETITEFDEPLDTIGFYELLQSDFGQISLYVDPFYMSEPVYIKELIRFLPKIPTGQYLLEDMILQSFLRVNKPLSYQFKEFLFSKVSNELITTVMAFFDSNLNSTKAAESLYLHRNSFNYRLDQFIDKTSIPVRTFTGAEAVHLLILLR